MGWLDLIPWRLVALVSVIGGLAMAWVVHGNTRYADGRASMRAEVQAVTDAANRDARNKEREHQEQVDALAKNYQAQLDRTSAALAQHQDQLVAATADGRRLRDTIRALTAVHPGPGAAATASADDATQALGQLLDGCSVIAERTQSVASASAAEAERLADQLRGLQSYATQVSTQ